MITLFTTLKPFTDERTSLIQRNALQSWLLLRPQCQIILLGNDQGVAKTAKEFGVDHVSKVNLNSIGLPLIGSLFKHAKRLARFPLLCYVNADIIFLNDFLAAITRLTHSMDNFLAVGRRWDMAIEKPLTFSNDWQQTLQRQARQKATLHGYSGMDYFVFPKKMSFDMPLLVIGRGGWDNWMVFWARSHGVPVVDITNAATVIHQEHDRPGKRDTAKRFIDAYAKQNIEYAGGYRNLLTIRDADWIFDGKALTKKPFNSLSTFYPWRLLMSAKRTIQQLWKRPR